MQERLRFGLPPLRNDRSIIVVSDLHLGGREDLDTAWRFCRFLEHLQRGPAIVSGQCCAQEGGPSGPSSGPRTLYPPDKIILLGDTFDLWDPRNQDRNRAFLNAILPLLKMRDMDCDMVFVAGNHDEDIAELIGSWDENSKDLSKNRTDMEARRGNGPHMDETPAGCSPSAFNILYSCEENGEKRPESLKIAWGGARTLEICNRHYPAHRVKGGKSGVKAGGVSYAFVHGQQFDKVQITHSISQVLGRRFDPVDFISDLACISAARRLNSVPSLVAILALAAVPWMVVSIPALNFLVRYIGAFISLVLGLILLSGVYAFAFSKKGRDLPSSRILTGISAVGSFIFLLILVLGWFFYPDWLQGMFLITLIASVFVLFVIAFPSLIAGTKRALYSTLSSSKSKTSEYVVKKKFDPKVYQYQTDILVFGHTHVADYQKVEDSEKVRLFINTGSWVGDGTRPEASDHDTFAYIDTSGVCCLRWNDTKKNIECYCVNKGISGNLPVCKYFPKTNV